MVREEVARAITTIASTGRSSGPPAPKTVPPAVHDWFVLELWSENREFLKEFITHAFFFGLFVLFLDLFHQYLKRTSLELREKELLNKFHFYATAVTVVIFGVSFVIGGMRNRFWRKKR